MVYKNILLLPAVKFNHHNIIRKKLSEQLSFSEYLFLSILREGGGGGWESMDRGSWINGSVDHGSVDHISVDRE